MMETTPGPAGVATAGDGVGRLSQMDIAAAASYLGVGGGARGVARRVTEEGDNDDEEGGFRCKRLRDACLPAVRLLLHVLPVGTI